MSKTTLKFPDAIIEVTPIENLIYVRITGIYTDEVMLAMLAHIEPLIDALPSAHIRVMDASRVPAGSFRLSTQGTEQAIAWGLKVHARKPGSRSFLIGTTPVSYGMGRMYAMRSDLEAKGVEVLRSLDELPPEVRKLLPSD